jgi:hypothetical protein
MLGKSLNCPLDIRRGVNLNSFCGIRSVMALSISGKSTIAVS